LGGFSPQEVENALFVGDEVHGFGSPSMVRELSGKVSPFGYRLGLSATPERIYDTEGQAFIAQEIGPTIFEFTLEDAIRKGILCEFDYTALPYELTDGDREAIQQAIRRHHARRAAGEASSDEALYRDLAAVRKTSVAKIPLFEQHLIERPDLYERALIFVETREYGEKVQKRLLDAGIVFGTYYQGAEAYRLRDFAAGRLQCLVSCHRLSEGIDIQSVRNIVLFASARARLETIQRLGRCLRVDPANPEKRAHVLDFVDLTSNDNIGKTADQERFDWFTSLSKVMRVEGE
jgi:superfamily II DNA or RNA helicase